MKRLDELFPRPEELPPPQDYAFLSFPPNPPWFSPEEAEELASTISEVHKTRAGVYIALGPPLPPEILIGFVSIAVATGFLNMMGEEAWTKVRQTIAKLITGQRQILSDGRLSSRIPSRGAPRYGHLNLNLKGALL